MEIMLSVWEFLKSDAGTGVLTGLLLVSEALASIPSIQSNSVCQLILGLLRRVTAKPAVSHD